MSLEVRQLVLRARVQDDDADDADDDGAAASRKHQAGCGGGDEDCEDKESLKEEILADCRAWLLEQLRSLRER